MNINNLNELPEWKDRSEEGEGWKQKPTLQACKILYAKWNEVMIMLHGALGSIKEIGEQQEDSFTNDIKRMLFSDAYEVGSKIRSTETGEGMYIIRMENAAIIRKNAQFVKSSVLTLIMEGEIEEEHGEAIIHEIEVFRELFIKWVNTFEKDEYTDEWGLFI